MRLQLRLHRERHPFEPRQRLVGHDVQGSPDRYEMLHHPILHVRTLNHQRAPRGHPAHAPTLRALTVDMVELRQKIVRDQGAVLLHTVELQRDRNDSALSRV